MFRALPDFIMHRAWSLEGVVNTYGALRFAAVILTSRLDVSSHHGLLHPLHREEHSHRCALYKLLCWQKHSGPPDTVRVHRVSHVARTGHNDDKPLCFVLPSASKDNLQELHRTYSSQVVREGDILLNIFPKHQAEIEAFSYPARVEEILDSTHFATRLCDCRAVVTSRLHGTILSLHAGMPTIAAWPDSEGNKIPSLMKEVLRFPNQFLLTDDTLTRETLDKMTQEVIERYSAGQRFRVFERIETIALHTQKEVERVLATVVHLQLPQGIPLSSERSAGGFWERVGSEVVGVEEGGMDSEVVVVGKGEVDLDVVVVEGEAEKAGPRIEIHSERQVGEKLPSALGEPSPAPVVEGEESFAPGEATAAPVVGR